MVETSTPELNVREQLAHIDQMLADAARQRQEHHFAPWQLMFTGLGAGTALFAAGAAFFKFLGR